MVCTSAVASGETAALSQPGSASRGQTINQFRPNSVSKTGLQLVSSESSSSNSSTPALNAHKKRVNRALFPEDENSDPVKTGLPHDHKTGLKQQQVQLRQVKTSEIKRKFLSGVEEPNGEEEEGSPSAPKLNKLRTRASSGIETSFRVRPLQMRK